ncbi:hypothetical protein AM588_10007320 [Phytophthora nicotianae]|uniref:PinX1-related protein 1 n=1 Tax=Phytophthora nicotianae TaxID=4792 RepID=A0A0W8DNP2_PHYNI|nr:hypothetical protein AM588_10007320 [Phytophthora nicotianae]
MPAVDIASSSSPVETDEAGKTMVAVGGMQNMAWASDTSKFGFKMLVKMGWSAGKGVGKDLQGQATHVKIARRSENLGRQSNKDAKNYGAAEMAAILGVASSTYKPAADE